MGSTQKQHGAHINFDEMLVLARTDPDTFEARREAYIESFLTSIPDNKQARLRGLQWQIDQKRQLARTPMASCIAISNLMWDSLHMLSQQQRELVKLATGDTSRFVTLQPASSTTTVIPFRSR